MLLLKKWLILCMLLPFLIAPVGADVESDQNWHVGVFHPNGGLELIGYSVERKMDNNLYWYYSFGFLSIAGIGVNYYSNRDGNGLTGNLGADLGSYIHASIAYQVSLGNRNFLKLGVGAADGFGYGGAVYSIIAYERRF